MKKLLTVILFLSATLHATAQIDFSKIDSFRNVNYKLDTLKPSAFFKLILARSLKEPTSDTPVFLHFENSSRPDSLINSLTSETGIYIPSSQTVPNYFILVSCSEYNGHIMLVDRKGQLTSFPGYHFAYDAANQTIYSKASGDGDNLVSKFNLRNRKLETKIWNNMNGEPWSKALTYYLNQNKDWIK